MGTTFRISCCLFALTAITFLFAQPQSSQADEIDTTPLALTTTPAFPNLTWAEWQPIDEEGRAQGFRPIILTHAGDEMKRIFVVDQKGVIHVFDNHQRAQTSRIFLDLSTEIGFKPHENETSFLGMAFHPQYKKNGYFFIYYTTIDQPNTTFVMRYRASEDDPDKADPRSGKEILRVAQPFWNHNGGTLVFGPDGYLYIALGDGGLYDDPHGNGQNLGTLLGSILRIDVDRTSDGKAYAIPHDNPFVNHDPFSDGNDARGEIWAYGFRNPWRIAFDKKTGIFWAADVGQNTWEEINHVTRGGNYGWKLREGQHTFVVRPNSDRPNIPGETPPAAESPVEGLVDPIWEYHHKQGRSIIGGSVYRSPRLPELGGHYLYADYISGKLWALKYDEASKRVTANRPLQIGSSLAVMSFGEDAAGEVYCLLATATGQGILRFERSPAPQ